MSRRAKTNPRGALEQLRATLKSNRRGSGRGMYSICSANRLVLEAGMLQAKRDGTALLIEATSNQVNQFGGYTGQTPREFVQFVHGIADAMKMPWQRIILGGDHLGPHVWRTTGSKSAMHKACELVRGYVQAGFVKIHLDASMPCADDDVPPHTPLPDEIVSSRAAELCEAAECAHGAMAQGTARPVYVIGTEVPIPGGELSASQPPDVTTTRNLARTLQVAEEAFRSRGLREAWKRVIAVVVQPGVEFGDTSLFHYDSRKAKALSQFCTRGWSGVYEAHSTDFQTRQALKEMVVDHFAILKVGPWLTFAFREAVFALEAIERELQCVRTGMLASGVQDALESAMQENPAYWRGYYTGGDSEGRFARRFSYSDRVRYYWPHAKVSAALKQLIGNLTANPAPLSLVSQYLPVQAEELRAGRLPNRPEELIRHKILEVIDRYAFACGMRRANEAAC